MAQDQGWSAYKSRFLMPDGRIIDTANKNVSHTEGQGFSMLLAVFNDDQATFDKLWQWANNTLYRKDIGLYSWRYDPNNSVHVADKNNASDGDQLIAWALLLAVLGLTLLLIGLKLPLLYVVEIGRASCRERV